MDDKETPLICDGVGDWVGGEGVDTVSPGGGGGGGGGDWLGDNPSGDARLSGDNALFVPTF